LRARRTHGAEQNAADNQGSFHQLYVETRQQRFK
jgi:hypothetical protein